jgi:cyclase
LIAKIKEEKLKQLVENIFYETGWRGANVSCIVTSEGLVLIEVPPDIENGKKWAAEIKKKGQVRYVINTESHHDHWVTNSLFGNTIFTHEKTLELMKIMDHKFIRERTSLIYAEKFDFPDDFALRLPNITFSQNMTIRSGKYTFQMIHTPGHTEGQMAVYIPEEKILFTGDTIVNRIRIPYHDCIMDDRWLESMKLLESLDVRYIVPGHGDILEGKSFIKEVTAVVRGFLKAVKTNGRRMDVELNKSFDPYYDVLPSGQKAGGVLLFNSAESKKSGNHGKMEGLK